MYVLRASAPYYDFVRAPSHGVVNLFPAFYPPTEARGILEHCIAAYTLAPIFWL